MGAGWSGYDNFAHWKSAGRKVTKDMVPKDELADPPGDTVCRSESDPSCTFIVSGRAEGMEEFIHEEEVLETLYQKLHRTKD